MYDSYDIYKDLHTLKYASENIGIGRFYTKKHYPSGRTWANICSLSGHDASLV